MATVQLHLPTQAVVCTHIAMEEKWTAPFQAPDFAWSAIAFTFYQRTGISNAMRFELNSGNRSRTPRVASLAIFTFIVVNRF